MAFLADADDPGLVVFPTHRLVHGLRGFRADALLEAAARDFVVTETRADRPEVLVRALAEAGRSSPSVAAIFPDGRAAVLALKPSLDRATHPILSKQPAVLRESDVVVLHSVLLEGVLGVTREQQAAYQHLHYFKSTADALAAIRRGEGEVLFLMNPTPVDLVRRACEAGEVMPQKSTFFYPKVLTGVAIHLLDPHVAV